MVYMIRGIEIGGIWNFEDLDAATVDDLPLTVKVGAVNKRIGTIVNVRKGLKSLVVDVAIKGEVALVNLRGVRSFVLK